MKVAESEIFSNKAKCTVCGQLLTSVDDSSVTCSCGQLTISGGNKRLIRSGNFVEMSLIQESSGLPDIVEDDYEQA